MRTKLGRPSQQTLSLIIAISLTLITQTSCHNQSNPAASPPAQTDVWTLQKLSGDLQTVRASDTLANRLVVFLKNQKNDPVSLEPITFTLIDGNGEIFSKLSPDNVSEVKTITGWNGQASANFKYFGPAQGAGQPKIKCSVDKDTLLSVTFTLNTNP